MPESSMTDQHRRARWDEWVAFIAFIIIVLALIVPYVTGQSGPAILQ